MASDWRGSQTGQEVLEQPGRDRVPTARRPTQVLAPFNPTSDEGIAAALVLRALCYLALLFWPPLSEKL